MTKMNSSSDSRIDAKIKEVEKIFILSPRHKQVLEMMKKCRRRSKLSREPMCMLILGRQGVGKTTTYEYFEQQSPRVETAAGTIVPVLSVQIAAPATVKSLVTVILRALGDPAAEKGTVVTQTLRLRRMLKDCGVEIIILDEFQHFIDSDSSRVLKTVSDWLKVLINETRIPIVLCGMPHSNRVLDEAGNEQLRDRFSARMYVEPYGWGPTPAERRDFRMFLAQVDEALPVRGNLGSIEMAYRLYCASNGYLRHVMYLIRDAAITAIELGKNKLDIHLLAQAFEDRYRKEYPKRANPFSSDFSDLEVVAFPDSDPARKKVHIKRKEKAADVVRLT